MDHVTHEDEAWGGKKCRQIIRDGPEGLLPRAGKSSVDGAGSESWTSVHQPHIVGMGLACMELKGPRPEGSLCTSHLSLPLGKCTGIKDRLLMSTGSLVPGSGLSVQSPRSHLQTQKHRGQGTAHSGLHRPRGRETHTHTDIHTHTSKSVDVRKLG